MDILLYLLLVFKGGLITFIVCRIIFRKKERELRDANVELQLASKSSDTELVLLKQNLQEAKENIEQQRLQAEAALEKEKNASKELLKAEREELKARFDEQVIKLQSLFKNSATEILEARTKDLSQTNSEQIKNILTPLNLKMEEFKKAVEEQNTASTKNSASLETQIKSMMEQTNAISKEAANLASALKSNNKTQGNWGEVILKNILEGMGLSMGKDFILQETIKDEDGNSIINEDSNKKMMPDAVLYLPDNKAIAIDSKVSLTAYVDYVNAESDLERDGALTRHCDSVRAHIKELSVKQYGKYLKQSGVDSMEYVVMFIPNEGAFQLFYTKEYAEWHKAFENKIIIAGESNLFAMLKVINVAWIQIQQQKSVDEVMKVAGELIDRVAKFANSFDDIGKAFDKTMKQYEDAKKKLIGRQSIATTSSKLEKMGVVSSSQNLRETLKAENELEENSIKQLNIDNDE